MSILDLVLIIILFFFVTSGFRHGLIHTLGTLIGTVVGVLVAGNYFEPGASLLSGILLGNENLARVVAFIIIFILTARLVGLAFWFFERTFKLLHAIPFLKSINHLAGGLLGLLEGAVILGVALIFIDKFPFAGFIIPAIENSGTAQWLLGYGKILSPLLPEAVKILESHVNFPEVPDINLNFEQLTPDN